MSSLTGLGPVLRFTARRDRVRLGLWIIGIVALVVVSAVSVKGLYPDQESIVTYVTLFGGNPALVAFAGPGYGFDDPNLGVVLVNETQVFGAIGMALMSMFLVNRQTRVEEESERADLIRARVVGRHAPTAASVIVVAGANLLVGVISAVSFIALGYATAGSIALAGSLVAVGLMFAGITALMAQVLSTGRGTLGLTFAILAVAFALRAMGDIGDNWVRWLSPMGWAIGVRAYAGERWWMLGACVLVTVGVVVAAFWVSTRRDLGAGIVAPRRGRPGAPAWMTRPLGLAVRLQRGLVVAWAVGMFTFAIVFGAIGEDIDEMLDENPAVADFFAQVEGASLTDAYFSTAIMMLAIAVAGYAISATLVARTEETTGRAESFIARPVHRWQWFGSHLLVAVMGTIVILAATGFGVGVAYAVVVSDAGEIGRMLGAALVTLPAVLVMLGLTAVLHGMSPRLGLAGWGALAFVFVVGYFGELLRLPGWVRGISPFHHLPGVPAQAVSWTPLIALTLLGAVLVAGALAALTRRDLTFQ